ncbi:hypothetical protein ACIQF6_03395 [Kitasatospora sp. NPDC092948]|uniref:hypothetical protein n=1 Tax=Kitasatospora sp. NPDC092948 TaxID=3364088 RepID=UPI00382EAEA9
MPASALARLLRAYIRHAPRTVGRTQLVDRFLDDHLRTRPLHTAARLRSGDLVTVTTSDVIQRFHYPFGEWEPNLSAFLLERGLIAFLDHANSSCPRLHAATATRPSSNAPSPPSRPVQATNSTPG